MADIRINVEEGQLAEYQADVLVNSTTRVLLLEAGLLSRSLLQKAGPQLQKECNRRYPDGILLGDVAVTSGYGLKCKHVYHGSLPSWDGGEVMDPLEVLCRFVCSCLELAHENKMTSIAFPALGCGFLGYPPEETAAIVYQCLGIFASNHPNTSLGTVTIVIFKQGGDLAHIKRAFKNQLNFGNDEASGIEPQPLLAPGMRDRQAGVLDRQEKRRQISERVRRLRVERQMAGSPDKVDGGARRKLPPSLMDTCYRQRVSNACRRKLKCGHACPGYRNEATCPPCLQAGCQDNTYHGQTADDDCVICYTNRLSAAPVCVLECGHVFHLHCARRVLENKWVGARITFNFLLCPICKTEMSHPELKLLLRPIKRLKDDVKRKALMRAEFEGLDKTDDVTNPASQFYNNVLQLALDRYCYYPCYKCKRAYFGGFAQCEEGDQGDFKPEDLICGACAGQGKSQVCPKHGEDFLEYKCRYCCTIAVFFCLGHTHFCQRCHDGGFIFPNKNQLPRCPAGPCGKQLRGKCPLRVKHPTTGTEYALGCGLCANLQSF